MLAELDDRLRWLNSFAPAAIADPTTPASMIEAIDRVLKTCRESMSQIDEVVDLVRQMYANECGREWRPSNYQFN
jgi:hypothetical protein